MRPPNTHKMVTQESFNIEKGSKFRDVWYEMQPK